MEIKYKKDNNISSTFQVSKLYFERADQLTQPGLVRRVQTR